MLRGYPLAEAHHQLQARPPLVPPEGRSEHTTRRSEPYSGQPAWLLRCQYRARHPVGTRGCPASCTASSKYPRGALESSTDGISDELEYLGVSLQVKRPPTSSAASTPRLVALVSHAASEPTATDGSSRRPTIPAVGSSASRAAMCRSIAVDAITVRPRSSYLASRGSLSSRSWPAARSSNTRCAASPVRSPIYHRTWRWRAP